MAQLTTDQGYMIWSYLSDKNWDGLAQTLQNQTLWNELGSDEAEALQKCLVGIKEEELAFPQNSDDFTALLNSWLA